MSKRFARTKEDFTCEHCDAAVRGTGYTNHCPQCLWSKHVDKNPGDREESCGGLMEPIRIEGTTQRYTLIHRCQKCKIERPNVAQKEDNSDAMILLAQKAAQ